MSFLDSPIFDAAEREWAEPPDDEPTPAESYEIHQKDGPCDCPDCRQYLERLR